MKFSGFQIFIQRSMRLWLKLMELLPLVKNAAKEFSGCSEQLSGLQTLESFAGYKKRQINLIMLPIFMLKGNVLCCLSRI